MIEMRTTQQPGETPLKITVSMIDQDLKDGVNKSEMAVKYGIKPWEVDEMFKHPLLKGRRPARKRTLSFNFVDDMTESTQFPNSMEDVTDEVDPNQVTLEDAIDEAIESVEEVKDQMQQTQEAIVNMLSPTKVQTPAESLLDAKDATMSIVEEQDWTVNPTVVDPAAKEEELEDEDDNTFEL